MLSFGKKCYLSALVSVLVVSMCLLAGPANAETKLVSAPNTIDIGISIELTGPTAMSGELLRRGYALALEKINAEGGIGGVPVRLIYEDDKGTNPGIIAAVNKLAYERKVVAILGCARSTQVHAVHTLATEAKVPIIYGGTAWSIRELKNPWLFGIRTNDRERAAVLATYLVEGLGHKKIASLHSDEAYGQGGSQETAKVLASKYGIEPLIDQMFARGTKDYTPQLLKIKQTGATAVYVWSPNPEDDGIILRQIKQLGLKVDVIGGAFGDPATTVPIAGKDAEGVYAVVDYCPDSSPSARYLYDRSMKDYGMAPSFINQEAYDGLLVMVDAMKRAGVIQTVQGKRMMLPLPEARAAIADALRAVKNLTEGVTRPYACDEYGDLSHSMTVARIKNGEHAPVETIDLLAAGR